MCKARCVCARGRARTWDLQITMVPFRTYHLMSPLAPAHLAVRVVLVGEAVAGGGRVVERVRHRRRGRGLRNVVVFGGGGGGGRVCVCVRVRARVCRRLTPRHRARGERGGQSGGVDARRPRGRSGRARAAARLHRAHVEAAQEQLERHHQVKPGFEQVGAGACKVGLCGWGGWAG